MDIIIDGYNLIGSDQGLRGALEPKRNWLIQRLSIYQKRKGFDVIIVFDGWRSGGVTEIAGKSGGVGVIYSQHGEKADSVIIRIARGKGSGCVVVTSDREIRNAVEKFGAVAIHSGQFADILRTVDAPLEDSEYGETEFKARKSGNPNRLSKTERRQQEKLKKLKL